MNVESAFTGAAAFTAFTTCTGAAHAVHLMSTGLKTFTADYTRKGVIESLVYEILSE